MEQSDKNIKRNSIIALAIFIFIAGIGGYLVFDQKKDEIKQLAEENSDLNTVVEERDSIVNNLISAFDEIEQNIDSIRMKRSQLKLLANESDFNQKEKIIEGVEQMNLLLEKSHQQIAKLEKRINRSGIQLSSFKEKITRLNETINKQNSQIAVLQTKLEEKEIQLKNMDEKVVMLEDVIASAQDSLKEKNELITQKEKELNTAHLCMGTPAQLEERGLLEKEADFFGLEKIEPLKEDFDENYFVEVDIRELAEIELNARQARFISEHPDSSYHFVEKDGLIAYLEIENPKEFWKISRYALIEIED